MLLNLPNELILLVSAFLPLHDIRKLRQACHRVHAVVSKNKSDHPLIIRNKKAGRSQTFQWREGTERRAEKLRESRAALIHLYLYKNRHAPPLTRMYMGPDGQQAIQELWKKFGNLQYLSLSCTVDGEVRDGDEGPSIYELPDPGKAFQHLSHFEVVGFKIDFRIFGYFPENLVEVSLCMPQSGPLYTEQRVHSFLLALKDQPLRTLTISADSCPLSLLARHLQHFKHLESFSLVWSDTDTVHGNRKVWDCTPQLDAYATTFASALKLRHVYVPLCPATRESVASARGSNRLGAGLLAECDRLVFDGPERARQGLVQEEDLPIPAQGGYPTSQLVMYARLKGKNKCKVVDTDVLQLMETITERAPGVRLVGWLVPVPFFENEFKTLWCKRTDDGEQGWSLSFEDSWPESNLDAVFS